MSSVLFCIPKPKAYVFCQPYELKSRSSPLLRSRAACVVDVDVLHPLCTLDLGPSLTKCPKHIKNTIHLEKLGHKSQCGLQTFVFVVGCQIEVRTSYNRMDAIMSANVQLWSNSGSAGPGRNIVVDSVSIRYRRSVGVDAT